MITGGKFFFEVKLDDEFEVKKIQENSNVVNTVNCRELHFDFSELNSTVEIDALPKFWNNVF